MASLVNQHTKKLNQNRNQTQIRTEQPYFGYIIVTPFLSHVMRGYQPKLV